MALSNKVYKFYHPPSWSTPTAPSDPDPRGLFSPSYLRTCLLPEVTVCIHSGRLTSSAIRFGKITDCLQAALLTSILRRLVLFSGVSALAPTAVQRSDKSMLHRSPKAGLCSCRYRFFLPTFLFAAEGATCTSCSDRLCTDSACRRQDSSSSCIRYH